MKRVCNLSIVNDFGKISIMATNNDTRKRSADNQQQTPLESLQPPRQKTKVGSGKLTRARKAQEQEKKRAEKRRETEQRNRALLSSEPTSSAEDSNRSINEVSLASPSSSKDYLCTKKKVSMAEGVEAAILSDISKLGGVSNDLLVAFQAIVEKQMVKLKEDLKEDINQHMKTFEEKIHEEIERKLERVPDNVANAKLSEARSDLTKTTTSLSFKADNILKNSMKVFLANKVFGKSKFLGKKIAKAAVLQAMADNCLHKKESESEASFLDGMVKVTLTQMQSLRSNVSRMAEKNFQGKGDTAEVQNWADFVPWVY